MPQRSVTSAKESKSESSLLMGWFSKLKAGGGSSNTDKPSVAASMRGRDRRGDRYAIKKKPRAAEIRKRGRPKAKSLASIVDKVRRKNKNEDASRSNFRGQNYGGKLSVISEADDADYDDDGSSVESHRSLDSNYSADNSGASEVSSAGSLASNASTASAAVSGSFDSIRFGNLWKSLDEKNKTGGERKGSVGGSRRSSEDDGGSSFKDFLDYLPWLKFLNKRPGMRKRLAGMDIEAAAAAGKEEEEEEERDAMDGKSNKGKRRRRRRIREERDSEWLQYSSSSDSNVFKSRMANKKRLLALANESDSVVEEQEEGDESIVSEVLEASEIAAAVPGLHDNSTVRSRQLTCEFIVILMPLFRLMQFMGRFPIEITTDYSKGTIEFRLDYKSRLYWAFYGTSILIGLALVSLTIQVSILPRHFKDPTSSYQEILLLEFEKYWVELSLTGFHLLMLTATNLAILHGDGGSFLVDFLNRWTFSITLLQNDVTLGLKKFLIIVAVLFCVYAAIFTILFFLGRNEDIGIPICRESSGVIFLFMIDNIFRDLRLTTFYAVMEYFGLFIHLYVCLSMTLIITLILTFCFTLNNAATQFHLKLEQSLCKDGEVSTKSELRKRRMTIIRKTSSELGNLFQEHLAVNSLARQFGGVFTLTLKAFVFAKIFSSFTAFYSVLIPLFTEIPRYANKFLNISSLTYIDQEKVIPIRNQEPEFSTMVKGAYYCFENLLIGWIVLEIAQKPGATLMGSEHYIRKRGLIYCTNSKERRFISSMLFSFSPRVRYALHPGIHLTRNFIAKLWGLMLVIAVTLVQFNHTRTSMDVRLICDKVGVCTEFSHVGAIVNHAEIAKMLSLEEAMEQFAKANQFVKRTTKLTTTTSTPTTTTPRPTTTTKPTPTTPEPDVLILPCLETSKLVNESEILESCGDEVFQPFVFSAEYGGFKRYPFACEKTREIAFNLNIEHVFDCYGNVVPYSRVDSRGQYLVVDECRNNAMTLPKTTANLTDSAESALVLQAIYLNESVELFCCYKYGGLRARNNPPCNLKSPDEAKSGRRCKPDLDLPVDDIRDIMESKVRRVWQNESRKMDSFDETWASCVCGKDKANCELVQKSLLEEETEGR